MNITIRILAIYGALSLTYRLWCFFLWRRRCRENLIDNDKAWR
jgi:hypothetical protein